MSINKQILVGHVGRDPEIKYTQTGTPVMNFSLATSKRLKEGQQETTWHRCVLFGKLVDAISPYVKKGSQLYIEGETRHRSYDNKEGNKVHITEVVVQTLEMLGGGSKKIAEERDSSTSRSHFDEDDMPF